MCCWKRAWECRALGFVAGYGTVFFYQWPPAALLGSLVCGPCAGFVFTKGTGIIGARGEIPLVATFLFRVRCPEEERRRCRPQDNGRGDGERKGPVRAFAEDSHVCDTFVERFAVELVLLLGVIEYRLCSIL